MKRPTCITYKNFVLVINKNIVIWPPYYSGVDLIIFLLNIYHYKKEIKYLCNKCKIVIGIETEGLEKTSPIYGPYKLKPCKVLQTNKMIKKSFSCLHSMLFSCLNYFRKIANFQFV